MWPLAPRSSLCSLHCMEQTWRLLVPGLLHCSLQNAGLIYPGCLPLGMSYLYVWVFAKFVMDYTVIYILYSCPSWMWKIPTATCVLKLSGPAQMYAFPMSVQEDVWLFNYSSKETSEYIKNWPFSLVVYFHSAFKYTAFLFFRHEAFPGNGAVWDIFRLTAK